ncbi:FAD-binding and (Fe-S)-binding domain-containing protein [Natronobeatus ordinarius]|uniref:FAD-binding and (Fe-S)-binding domain-containing protein n=1 Tax=Natronobeatus ordinarius TaxID=2963433 RepID=UPI0020CCAF60|nr:FAD-binding and (Fe-S)-binding domain-containing protein [Natronobeatus ordinarius]
MATEDMERRSTAEGLRPAADEGGHERLARDLRAACDGDVRFDRYTRVCYATDGSIYGAEPAGVVFPRDVADVQAAVRVASDHEVPVLPRGAGSSLAGQAVGPGCVVLDCSRHLDAILEVDPEARTARVQPGVVQDDLDDHLAEWGLKFAPDPASANRATIGGGIGNNSTGAHSVRYGITDASVDELRVVLSNGELIHTREVVLDGEEYEDIVSRDTREAAIYETVRGLVEDHEDEIEARYPNLKRRVTGYNLDRVIYETDDGEAVINLSKLLVGAEGTLGVVVEATVSLVSNPEETALALYAFEDLLEALEAVPEALEFPVSAVELMDEEVFRLASESDGYAEYADPIPGGAAAALMLEWDDELVSGDDQRAAFESAVADTTAHFVANGDAFDVLEAYEEADQERLWKLRKAAIPLLMSLEGDPKPYPFIEDATVPPAELAEYVSAFEEILEAHDTSAAYFAHAGSGTLHIRPILNLKEEGGVEAMRSIADDVTDLVLEHHGSFSGEHGDGMARTEFTPKMYGEELWGAFKRVKTAFDPDWLLHPGNVVYRDGPDDPGPDSPRGVGADMREHLRYGPDYYSLEPRTTLEFDDEGGFSHLVELCNGCGTCRQTDRDVMCPTYRASEEEITTTRGRANLLRAAVSGDLPPEELYTEEFQRRVLDLCIGCKGCQSDCPTGVDLAKLKAEVKHQYHDREGISARERLFANVDRLAALGSRLAPLSNYGPRLPGSRRLLERTLGIAPERSLPSFAGESLVSWYDERGPRVNPATAIDRVVLYPDTYTNYTDPDPGKAAVAVLEAADVHVEIPSLGPTGRAAYSQGLLDVAADRATALLDDLESHLERGRSVLFLEPSDASMVVDEYGSLLSDSRVETLAANAVGVCAYLDWNRVVDSLAFDADVTLAYHGHCHQKALGRDHHAVTVLRQAGYAVDPLESGCCGMAGSFGYEADHYDLSRAIGRLLLEQLDESAGEAVVAPGASCRTQVGDFAGYDRPHHPIEALAAALE